MTDTSPLSVDPFGIKNEIFLFASAEEYQTMFENFFYSATSNQYTWNEGGPGNLLFVSSRFELMIEIAFLINHSHRKQALKQGINIEAIANFFTFQSLREWKRSLHTFTEAAFGNENVGELMEVRGVVEFNRLMQSLIHSFSS